MRSFIAMIFLAVAASAMPQEPRQTEYEIIPIVRSNAEGPAADGSYSFDFETGDGVVRSETGTGTGPEGTVVSKGSWSFTFPDGTPAEFTFTADENGYIVESALIPEIPAHALEQIARSERERAEGVVHDGQWDPARYA